MWSFMFHHRELSEFEGFEKWLPGTGENTELKKKG